MNSEWTNLNVLSGRSPAPRRKKLGAEEAKLDRTQTMGEDGRNNPGERGSEGLKRKLSKNSRTYFFITL